MGMNFDNEDDDDDDDDDHEEEQKIIPFRDQTNLFFRRRQSASQVRGICPLTHDGAFGINSAHHGIRLCSFRPSRTTRTCILHRHFLRIHKLTSVASLQLARAVASGADPLTTKLFTEHDTIFNADEYRIIQCPIQKPFDYYPNLQIGNKPCPVMKKVRDMREHLKHDHHFTVSATTILMKMIKTNQPIHSISFPLWCSIVKN